MGKPESNRRWRLLLLAMGSMAAAWSFAQTLPPESPVPARAGPSAAATKPAKPAPGKAGKTQVAAVPATARPGTLQGAIANLSMAEGNVLVSTRSGLVAATEGTVLPAGTRVITTSNASARITFFDGCIVELAPNQRIEVNAILDCPRRVLLAQGLIIDPASLAAALGGSTQSIAVATVGGMPGSVGTIGGLGGAAALLRSQNEETLSPN